MYIIMYIYTIIHSIFIHRQDKRFSSWAFQRPFPVDSYQRSFYLESFYLGRGPQLICVTFKGMLM